MAKIKAQGKKKHVQQALSIKSVAPVDADNLQVCWCEVVARYKHARIQRDRNRDLISRRSGHVISQASTDSNGWLCSQLLIVVLGANSSTSGVIN